ncbi:uncharacterized protein LOC144911306 [Branchiostoma floridae x Branchiostoma belcheri]
MARNPGDLQHPVEKQPSANHPHVKVKLKRSSVSWEVHSDQEERDDATVTCKNDDTIVMPKQQTVTVDSAKGRVHQSYFACCSSFQNDLLCEKIIDSDDTRTTVGSQKCPSGAKEVDLQHRCNAEISESTLPPDEKSSLVKEANVKMSLTQDCRKVRTSCPETLTYETPRAGYRCTDGSGNEQPRLDVVRPSCSETVTCEKPSTEGSEQESPRLCAVRPNGTETVIHKKQRTRDNKCTEGSGNELPRLEAVRETCRKLLAQAFERETHNIQLVRELANSIEDHIFSEFKNTGTKYKNRVRSRIANLKDPQNPELRRRLVQGDITPQQMATMSAQEMASEEVKKFRRQVSEESIQRRQVPHADGTMTDMFKCENCGRENCCYNQYRGFSADGPIASPFVFCMDCGNRWKFF